MDELSEEIKALKHTVKELKDANTSLTNQVQALRSEVTVLSLNNQATTGQQPAGFPVYTTFTPTMPDKYQDTTFLSLEERKEIQFQMESFKMNCARYDEGKPARFYHFARKGEEDKKKYQIEEDDGITATRLGTFLTPIPGRYRFNVKGRMEGSGKATWYICCVHKDEELPDEDSDAYDSDDDDEVKKKKEERKDKERIFNQKVQRQVLFLFPGDGDADLLEGCVGMDCERGLRVWVEVVVLEGRVTNYGCQFSGRLVC